jgi:hypothetical protein
LKIEQVPEIKTLVDYFDYNEDIQADTGCKKVFELCDLRNSYALEAGYSSYPHLALSSQGFPYELKHYDDILKYIDEPTPINLPDLTCIEDYWKYYSSVAEDGIKELDVDSEMIRDFILLLLKLLGEEKHTEDLLIVVKNKPGYNLACDLTVDDDNKSVGILIAPKGIRSLFTCVHELGHALLYLNQKNNRYFLPVWLDETYGVYLEKNVRLLKRAFGDFVNDETAIKLLNNRDFLEDMELRRIYASLMVEIDLWGIIRQNMSLDEKFDYIYKSYNTHHNRYLNSRFVGRSKWYNETFRTIDPVYIHSYILAEKYYYKINNFLYSTGLDTIRKILNDDS